METHLTTRQLLESFDAVIDRINASGDTLVIEKDGLVVCNISPPAAPPRTGHEILARRRQRKESRPPLDAGFEADLAAFHAAYNQPAVPENRWDDQAG